MKTHTCEYCNNEFSAQRDARHFCSRDCWYRYLGEHGFPTVEERNCKACGQSFLPPRRRQVFCSVECYGEFEKNEHGFAWRGGKPKCAYCQNTISYYSKVETPICMDCRRSGKAPWGKDSPSFTGYCISGKDIGERSQTWKKKLFERDGYACVNCGYSKQTALTGAHIIPVSEDPSKSIDLDNGVILCWNCHTLYDSGEIEIDYPYTGKECIR